MASSRNFLQKNLKAEAPMQRKPLDIKYETDQVYERSIIVTWLVDSAFTNNVVSKLIVQEWKMNYLLLRTSGYL